MGHGLGEPGLIKWIIIIRASIKLFNAIYTMICRSETNLIHVLMVIKSACPHNEREIVLFPSTLKNGSADLVEYFIRVFVEWTVLLHIFRVVEHIFKGLFLLEIIIKPPKPGFLLHIQKKCPVGEW